MCALTVIAMQLKKHKLELSENFIAEGDFSFASGMIAAEKLLQHRELTAIFASNDDMAPTHHCVTAH